MENVEVMEDCHIKFDFLGKDSIRYENEVQVHPRVHELVREFCRKDSRGTRERLAPLCLAGRTRCCRATRARPACQRPCIPFAGQLRALLPSP